MTSTAFSQNLDLPLSEEALESQLAVNKDDLKAQYFTVDSLLIATKERLLEVEAGGFEYKNQIVKIPYGYIIPGLIGSGVFYYGAKASLYSLSYDSDTLGYLRQSLREYYEASYFKNMYSSHLKSSQILLDSGIETFDRAAVAKSLKLEQASRFMRHQIRRGMPLFDSQHLTRSEVVAFMRNTEPLYKESLAKFALKRRVMLGAAGNAAAFSPFIVAEKIPFRMIAGGALIFYSYQTLTDKTVIIDSKTVGDIRESVKMLEEKLESLRIKIGDI